MSTEKKEDIVTVNPEDFPGNTNKERAEKQVKSVVTGKVTRKKKSFAQKTGELFVGEEIDNVWNYILVDVMVPAAKNMISDMVSQGIQMFLFGSTTSRHTPGNNHVNYSDYSRRNGGPRVQPTLRNQQLDDFTDIIFETRNEADAVLSNLEALVQTYGQATKADFFDLCGITSEFTDHRMGWRSVELAKIEMVRGGGFRIVLPRPLRLS